VIAVDDSAVTIGRIMGKIFQTGKQNIVFPAQVNVFIVNTRRDVNVVIGRAAADGSLDSGEIPGSVLFDGPDSGRKDSYAAKDQHQ